ncbi:helix-turn-helix domain-containing protein [Solwaraspora sp. WMMA2101]|uniref:helix-turn-helix domain-containing protein n=1 Tax=Solwaraspora sp. WMMA2101 TaxID=3404124 RepID=UPI003B95A2C0
MRARLRSWAAVGGRVAAARELAGFSQRELAERLGIHRSALTRVELGQRQLDALELSRIAELLGRTVEWFLTVPAETLASRRAGISADHDVQRLEDALDQVSRDVELLSDVGALTLAATGLQSGVTTLAEAEAGAAEARALLGCGDGPLVDLQAMVERLGLLAFSLDLGPGVIDGGYLRTGQVGVALVNGAAIAGQRRVNLAHELGHHLLADEYAADVSGGSGRSEREALIDAFAIHFLMPGPSVIARWAELSGEWDYPRQRLFVLSAEYRVNWSAVVSHAYTLELISRAERDLLQVQRPTVGDYIEVRGARFAQELRSPALAPAYAQAAMRAYRRGVISADRVVELLHGTVTLDDLPTPASDAHRSAADGRRASR